MNVIYYALFLLLLFGPLIFSAIDHVREWGDPGILSGKFWSFQKIASVVVVTAFLLLAFVPLLFDGMPKLGLSGDILPLLEGRVGSKGNPLFPFVVLPVWALVFTLFPHVVSYRAMPAGLFVERIPNVYFALFGHFIYLSLILVYVYILKR